MLKYIVPLLLVLSGCGRPPEPAAPAAPTVTHGILLTDCNKLVALWIVESNGDVTQVDQSSGVAAADVLAFTKQLEEDDKLLHLNKGCETPDT